MNNHEEYNDCKTQLEQIYKIKANGIKIRSKCEWYEHGEKSSKFFLNLEKSRAIQGQVRTVIYNDKETNDETEINNHICSFFSYLYKETFSFSRNNLETYLNTISFPKLTKEKRKTLDGGITENELFSAFQNMKNNKSPGNDGLTKEFHIKFWNEVKGASSTGNRKSLSCKTTQYIAKTSSNKINRKKRRKQKLYSKLATYFLT